MPVVAGKFYHIYCNANSVFPAHLPLRKCEVQVSQYIHKMLKQTCSTAGGPAGRIPALRCSAVGRPAGWSSTAVGPWAHGPRGGRASARAGILMENNVQHVAGQRVDVTVVPVAMWTRLPKQKHQSGYVKAIILQCFLHLLHLSNTDIPGHQALLCLASAFLDSTGNISAVSMENCPSHQSPGIQYSRITIATQLGWAWRETEQWTWSFCSWFEVGQINKMSMHHESIWRLEEKNKSLHSCVTEDNCSWTHLSIIQRRQHFPTVFFWC